MSEPSVPADFELLNRKSAFSDLTGPYYIKTNVLPSVVLGLRIEADHLNKVGVAHGGALLTLADNAIGDAVIRAFDQTVAAVTVSMSSEFMSPAVLGDWVVAETRVNRKGRRLVFVECMLSVGNKKIMRASAVMALVKPRD